MKWGKKNIVKNKNSKEYLWCLPKLNFALILNLKSVATFFYYCVIVGQVLKDSFEDPSVDEVLDHSWRTGAQIAGL